MLPSFEQDREFGAVCKLGKLSMHKADFAQNMEL